jgi:hypothetical protein
MANKQRSLKRKTYYSLKIKRAVQLLFYKRHRIPGVKGWELRRKLGSDYPKVLDILKENLEKLGLTIKIVFEEEDSIEKPKLDQLDKARFYVTLKGQSFFEAKLVGWRIDDLAGLAVTIGYIICKMGKVPRKEVENLLRIKLPGWRVDLNLNRYLRNGYIVEDENGFFYLGWRALAEVDKDKLIDMFLGSDENLQNFMPYSE